MTQEPPMGRAMTFMFGVLVWILGFSIWFSEYNGGTLLLMLSVAMMLPYLFYVVRVWIDQEDAPPYRE